MGVDSVSSCRQEKQGRCRHRHHRHRHHHHHHHHRYHREKTPVGPPPKSSAVVDSSDSQVDGSKAVAEGNEGCQTVPACKSVEEEGASHQDVGKERSSCHTSQRSRHDGRVLRNRRYRRPFEDHRNTKRLFTPELKKYLKGWLVRRRDNPYPNREEKKELAVKTGLTYIQICNWFANWRRKLKNAGVETRQRTWGHLIKSYNTQAQGNVEQFSISSDDSIWEEPEPPDLPPEEDYATEDAISTPGLSYTVNAAAMDHCYSVIFDNGQEGQVGPDDSAKSGDNRLLQQCFQITSTTKDDPEEKLETIRITITENAPIANSSKYKSHIMEKYLKDVGLKMSEDAGGKGPSGSLKSCRKRRRSEEGGEGCGTSSEEEAHSPRGGGGGGKRARKESPPVLLSKWLESAAKFQPSTQSYVTWTAKNFTWTTGCPQNSKIQLAEHNGATSEHQREELEAAEALTRLSGLYH